MGIVYCALCADNEVQAMATGWALVKEDNQWVAVTACEAHQLINKTAERTK